jgi:hypothetical protein
VTSATETASALVIELVPLVTGFGVGVGVGVGLIAMQAPWEFMKNVGLHIKQTLLLTGLHDKHPDARVLFAQLTHVPLEKNEPSAQSKQFGVLTKNDWAQFGSTRLE